MELPGPICRLLTAWRAKTFFSITPISVMLDRCLRGRLSLLGVIRGNRKRYVIVGRILPLDLSLIPKFWLRTVIMWTAPAKTGDPALPVMPVAEKERSPEEDRTEKNWNHLLPISSK